MQEATIWKGIFQSWCQKPLLSECSIENCHMMHTITNIQHLHDETLTLPIHEHLPRLTIQTENTTSTTQTHTSTLQGKKTRFLTMAATQQTFPQTPTQSVQQT